jgi:hypothetical protein
MTTFVFTEPNGKVHEVTGPAGATKEQAFQILQSQLAGRRAPAIPNKGPDPSEGMRRGEKLLVGAGYAVDRTMRGASGLVRSAAEAMGAKFDPDDKAQREAEDAALYKKYHPGGWATAGEVEADVAMSALPVLKGGSVLGKALAARRVPLAGAAGDIAANAAYSAATAPEDRGSAAALGGAGAAGGRALAKAMGARVPNIPAAARQAADKVKGALPEALHPLLSAKTALGGGLVVDPISTLTIAALRGPAARGLTAASGKGLMDMLPDGPLKKQLAALDPAIRDRVVSALIARLATQQQQQ